ncbi:hypothetical protein I79_010821 [Cricetulus griseus]|uniref:Uncharacterized protein n=1 Tax=Cricetulus griseus TaxID=10029 RepID=G3HJH6_CRIGR|nr:hypothetical protein I79_010821 [Cricetulus griseus]
MFSLGGRGGKRKCRSHKLGTYVVRKTNQLRQKWGKLFENWSKNPQRECEGNKEGQSRPSGAWRGPHGSV